MLTKEIGATYDSLPETVKSAILALSVLVDRIGSLPKCDRDDLFELLNAWRDAADPEEQVVIRRAMEEILAQAPVTAKPLNLTEVQPLAGSPKNWADHVGRRIRSFRAEAGLRQAQLAERAGLTQSHISRLENAEHTATNFTLEKIAKALGKSVRDLDPCVE